MSSKINYSESFYITLFFAFTFLRYSKNDLQQNITNISLKLKKVTQ